MPADAFSALTEIDPRLAGTVLDALAEAGIAAWVRPFAGTMGGYLEVRMPARPLDCLYVDAGRRGDALSVLAEQVPDLLGLRSRDTGEEPTGAGAPGEPESGGTGSAAADGTGSAAAAVPRAEGPGLGACAGDDRGSAAGAAGGPGDDAGAARADATCGPAAQDWSAAPAAGTAGPGAPAGGPDGREAEVDVEAAFAEIVAGYAREAHNPFDLPPGSRREGRTGDERDGGAVGDTRGPGADGPALDCPGLDDPEADRPGTNRPEDADGVADPTGPAAGTEARDDAVDGASTAGRDNCAWRFTDIPRDNASESPDEPPANLPNTWFVPTSGRLSSGPPGANPSPDDSDADLDDHYDPPPAPPTPLPSPPTRWALVSIGLGLLLLIAPALVALQATDLVHVAGVLMICAGVGILVARMRHEDDDDDSDDGAVV